MRIHTSPPSRNHKVIELFNVLLSALLLRSFPRRRPYQNLASCWLLTLSSSETRSKRLSAYTEAPSLCAERPSTSKISSSSFSSRASHLWTEAKDEDGGGRCCCCCLSGGDVKKLTCCWAPEEEKEAAGASPRSLVPALRGLRLRGDSSLALAGGPRVLLVSRVGLSSSAQTTHSGWMLSD